MPITGADEAAFFADVQERQPAAMWALRKLYELRTEPRIRFEAGIGGQEKRLKLFVDGVSPAALMLIGADGQTEFMFDTNRPYPEGLKALESIYRDCLQVPLQGVWSRKKPYLSMSEWGHPTKLKAMTAFLRELARREPSASQEPSSEQQPVAVQETVAVAEPRPPAAVSLNLEPTDDPEEFERRAASALLSGVPLHSTGIEKPERLLAKDVYRFKRDPAVKAEVLSLAAGNCESCDAPAPFQTAEGLDFLEVHHVLPLSESGPDFASNAVAVCPNCHRALHHAKDAAERRSALWAKVKRLKNPGAAS